MTIGIAALALCGCSLLLGLEDHGRGSGADPDARPVDVSTDSATPQASLSALSISGAAVSPAFAPDTLAYAAAITIPVLFSKAEITVTATARDARAHITVAGEPAVSGSPSAPVALKTGANAIDIAVVAADGKTERHYAVVVNAASNDYLKASNTHASATFSSVALAGETLAVGAPNESSSATGVNGNQRDDSALGSGAVYVFTRSGTLWTQQAYIKASNTRRSADFGGQVALWGSTLAVGAPGESSNATGVNGNQADTSMAVAGAVYIFTRTGTVWRQQAYVKASNTRPGAQFGSAVSISADTLAVGSYLESSGATGVNGAQDDTSSPSSGAAYVFTRSGAVWTQQAYVKASNTRVSALFGRSIALSGDTLAVGSTGESSGAIGRQGDTSAALAGAAYVFTRAASAWSQQAYVKASNTRTNAQFGSSVALMGDTLAVGAAGDSSNATGVNGDQTDTTASASGAAYVFRRSGAIWSQEAYIKASNTREGAGFGGAVALAGDALVVGADEETSNAVGINGDGSNTLLRSAGAAYLFMRAGTAWSQRAYVKASNTRDGLNGTYFGGSVALSADTLAVGAPGETSNATGVNGNQADSSLLAAGAVYVYR